MPDFESLYNESQANAFTSAKKRFYDNKVDNLNEENYDGKPWFMGIGIITPP